MNNKAIFYYSNMYNNITVGMLNNLLEGDVDIYKFDQVRNINDILNNGSYDKYDDIYFFGLTKSDFNASAQPLSTQHFYIQAYGHEPKEEDHFTMLPIRNNEPVTSSAMLYLHQKGKIKLGMLELGVLKNLVSNYTISDQSTLEGEQLKSLFGLAMDNTINLTDFWNSNSVEEALEKGSTRLLLSIANSNGKAIVDKAISSGTGKQIDDTYYYVTSATTMFKSIAEEVFKLSNLENVVVIIHNFGKNGGNDSYYIYASGNADASKVSYKLGGRQTNTYQKGFAMAHAGNLADIIMDTISISMTGELN